jgi:hypothetical protein
MAMPRPSDMGARSIGSSGARRDRDQRPLPLDDHSDTPAPRSLLAIGGRSTDDDEDA